ncbi:MAG: S-layer homology domain-containing protein [Candidatus Gracilibacteria bacterium]
MVNSIGFARRAVAGVATAAILATQLVTAPFAAAQTAEFSDVPSDHFAHDYIYELVDMGVVSGNPDGTFRPNAYLNRAEMAKIATKLATISGVIADADDLSNAPSFSDVSSDVWFYGYVSAAAKNGIFEGYRDAAGNLTGMFGPSDTVLRSQAAKVLMIAAGVPTKMTPAAPFVDVNPSDWFYGYVTSAYNWSILDGYKDAAGNLTGYFGPADPVTRGQIAKIGVNSQSPIDRYTQVPLGNMNTNNANTNTGTGSNMNSNVPMSNASFEAALSSSTPTGVTLATGTAFNTVAKIDLTAGTQEDVKVSAITIMHRGLSPDSIVNGVLVVDKDGNRHGNIVSFSDSKATVDFSSNPIMVAKGTTHTIAIQTNFNASTNFSGTYKAEIPANGIMAWGASTGGLVKVMGTFPISGPEYALVSGSNIAAFSVEQGTNHGGQNLDLGVTNRPVASFKFEMGNSNESILISELTVYNNGTTADGDVKNLKLIDQGGVVLATADQTMNRYATFKFAQPYEISKGNSRTLDLVVDVVNGSSRTVEFQILNDYDVKVKGSASQAFLLPTNPEDFPLSGSAASTINPGTLILSRSTTSPSGEISNGADDTVLAEFKVEAFGEDIEIRGGDLTLDWTVANPTTGTVRLMTSSGQTLHSVTSTEFADGVAESATTFNSSYTVKAGSTTTLRVVANINESAANGSTIIASLENLRYKRLSSNQFSTTTGDADGNSLTVSTATVTVSKNTSTASEDVVAGGVSQAIGSFNVKATNSGNVNITSVKLNVAHSEHITNLKLKNGNTFLGTAIAAPAATNNNFSFAGQLVIPAGQTVTLTAYADIKTGATATDDIVVTVPQDGVTGTANNSDVSAPAADVALQSFNIATAGIVTLSTTNTVSNSRVVTSGATNESILSFKAKAADREAMILNKLTVKIYDTSANGAPGSVESVVIKKDGVNIAAPSTLILAGGVYTVEFTGLNQEIARNAEAQYTVAVNLTNNNNAFIAGGVITASIVAYEATGKSSGQLNNNTNIATDEATGSVQLTLHKVTPVIAKQSIPTTAVPGTTTTVAKFSVTANGSETMQINELNFTVGGNKAAAITNAHLYRISGGSEVLVATNHTTTADDEVSGVLVVTLTGTELVSVGETITYVLKANTSMVMNNGVDPAQETASVGLTMPANGFEYSYGTGPTNATAPTNEIVFETVTF